MTLDDLVLALQRLVDRLVRRLRLGPPPLPGRRRLLIVQIDGLSRAVLQEALAQGRMPFVRSLLRHGFRLAPMSVGLPTSTPAFQLSAMYGVRPDIPGFHYHDKRRRADVYFPRSRDAAWVEATQAAGREGILDGGSAYGCVFTGGAANNVFNFARMWRPGGRGLLRALSGFVVLYWVLAKGSVATVLELGRAAGRSLRGERPPGWKFITLKVAVSVWVRQLFTLGASRDLYAGAPAVYVNYLDYDVMAHAYGPRHRRAFRALRRVDASLRQLWRVVRRVPGHGYDLYVLSDHGLAEMRSFRALNGGRPLERLLFEDFFDRVALRDAGGAAAGSGELVAGLQAYRRERGSGLVQRFVNYIERDFLGRLRSPSPPVDRAPEAVERDGVRVISAGPNAFVYFLHETPPLAVEAIDERHPGLVDDISRARGIGFVLVRAAGGPVCVWRGKRYPLDAIEGGPFADRPDRALVAEDLRQLMAMPSAGDLVIYGHASPDGDVSFVDELGAHAGPGREELETFIVAPERAPLPAPIEHPVQLYPFFLRYRA
ncbi:MAG: alkaline phosphatase family protein [Candidatus Rokubacteria bacterium]|nr:alkaline phosphatase family protein [Candidatus Rokubacteria bacterium]MBI3827099.1 alkaline phosphatase family protein [Candidatus Rokubacteria bacterium]